MFKFINLLSLLIFTINLQANDNDPTTLAQAEKWLSTANEKGFLENKGQMMDNEGKPVPQVLFKTEAPDLIIWVTQNGLTIQTQHLRKESIPENELNEFDIEEVKRKGRAKTKKYIDWERLDIELKNATIKKENILTENPIQGHNNYFYPTCPDGIYGVKEYEKITIKDVYPGIDWVLYRKHTPNPPEKSGQASQEGNNEGSFKYDFIVHPGADYHQIELIYKSKTPININDQGELEMFTIYGNVKENKPVSFYETQEIATRFIQNYQKPTVISGDNGYETSISFSLNTSLNTLHSTLIIDPQLTWATYYGGSNADGFQSIDTDKYGNIFIAGYTGTPNFPLQNAGTYFQGTYGGGSGDALILKFDNTGNRLWVTYYGGSEIDIGNSITIDSVGNVFVTGVTSSLNFPLQDAGTFFQGTNSVGDDAFILKFDNAGNRLWATYYGGSGSEWGNSITTDGQGNVFVTGFTNSLNLPLQNSGTFFQGAFGGNRDVFILKFDNDGNRLWATYYGGSGYEWGTSITTDSAGNVFVTGYSNSINFPTQNAGTFFQGANGGSNDAFILKFDSISNRLWATYYGGIAEDRGESITTDWAGNLFVTGRTASSNFPLQNAGTFFQGTYGGGMFDVFILKFDNIGNRLWATYYGGNGWEVHDSEKDIAIDKCGNVYVSFNTNSSNIFTMNSCDTGGYYDASIMGRDQFIALFSNTGTLNWATYIGGNGYDFRQAIALDVNNNLFITGEWLGSNPSTYMLTDPGNGAYFDNTFNGVDDSFIAKFCNNNCICSPYDGCLIINVCIVDTLTQNLIICQGDSVSVGTNIYSTTGTFIDTLTNILGCDSIITTNLTVNPIITGIDLQTSCDSYTWIDGVTYTASTNIPTFTLTNTAGCDSVVTLNLTINSRATSTDVQTACNTLTWIDGNTYTASTNTPTFTIVGGAATGCDSVITLNLTINSTATSTDVQTACNTLTWIDGNTYTSNTNTPTFTIVGSAATGCDSVITLNLTISTTTFGTEIQTACDSFTWIDGITYTSSTNTPTFTILGGASSGCDSVITLNLTISTTAFGTDIQTACDSFTWIDGITYTSSTNTPTFTILGGASSGCDSVVTLNLTINSLTTSTDTQTACDSYTWIDGNTYTSSNNTVTFTLTNAVGCDSVITLNLTIIDPISTTQTFTECQGFSIAVGSNTYTTTGVFTDVINGCDTMITNLTINDSPQFTLIKEDDNCGEHIGSVLVNVTSSIPPVTYVWNTGSSDSILSNLPAGTYTVTVNDGSDCSNINTTSILDLELDCESFIFIPSVFTPNGDGQNDEFIIQLKGLEFISLEIYNRWGIKLFESTTKNKGWDGKTNTSNNATDGTYFFIVSYKTTGDEIMIKKGTLTLLR